MLRLISHLNHELNPNKVKDESAPMHAMQTYLEIRFLPFLNSVLGGCTRVRAPVQWEVVGLHLCEDMNLLPLPRVEPRVFGCTARRLVAVPTGLRSPVPCDRNIKIFKHSKYLQCELVFRGNERQSEGYASGVFLRLRSTYGCQRFRELKMRNCGRVLLAAQNFVCTSVNERPVLIVLLSVIL
jgi:hypothetical protein